MARYTWRTSSPRASCASQTYSPTNYETKSLPLAEVSFHWPRPGNHLALCHLGLGSYAALGSAFFLLAIAHRKAQENPAGLGASTAHIQPMQGQGAVPRYPSSGHVAKCSQSRTTSATNIGYWTTDDHGTTYNVLHAPTPQPMLQISDLGSAFRHESNVAARDLMLWQGLAVRDFT